jgi:hypothetical protein
VIAVARGAVIVTGVLIAHPANIHIFHHYKSNNDEHLEHLKKWLKTKNA